MNIIVIETPFRADRKKRQRKHLALAVGAMEYALSCGLAPFASHLLYTMPLADSDPAQRLAGLHAGRALSGPRWFMTDLGWSDGMRLARDECITRDWLWCEITLSHVHPQWRDLIVSKRINHLRKALYW